MAAEDGQALDTSVFVMGESLRAIALAWLAIAVGFVAAEPLLEEPWSWFVIAAGAVSILVGVAYWWVVPFPPDDEGDLPGQAESAAALLDQARIVTWAGVTAAAVVTGAAILVSPQRSDLRIGLVAGCGALVLIAAWWASTPYESGGSKPQRRVVVLNNGRFVLSALGPLDAWVAAWNACDAPIRKEVRENLRQAVEAEDPHRRALLERAAASHARLAELWAVNNTGGLSTEELLAYQAGDLARTGVLDARRIVFSAWGLILRTAVPNLRWRFRLRRRKLQKRLAAWRSRSTDYWGQRAAEAPLAELTATAEGRRPAGERVDALEAALKRWAPVSGVD